MPNYRLRLARSNALKLKVTSHVNATVIEGVGIDVTRSNAGYTVDVDFSEFSIAGSVDSNLEATTYVPLYESSGDDYSLINVNNLGIELGLPTSSTDNAVPRYDGTAGAFQDSGILLGDTNILYPATSDGGALGDATHHWSDAFLALGAVVNWSNGDVTLTHAANSLAFAGAASGYTFDNLLVVGTTASLSVGGNADNAQIWGSTAATGGLALGMANATAGTSAHLDFYRSKNAAIGSATVVASGDVLGAVNFYGAQQTGTFSTQTMGAQVRAEVDGTVTSGASGDMPSRLVFATTADSGSAVTDRLILDSAGILKPNANDGVALGTSSLSFADMFLASGAVINFNAGDVTVTHAANNLLFAGASTGYTFDAKVYPTSDDGAALGDATHNFSDLFLASGGVINFANSDITITHSSNTLTFAGAATGYVFDAPMSGVTTFTLSSYIDLTEIASPSSPSADHLRLFVKDVAGSSHLFTRDSGGTEVDLSAGGGGGASAATQAEMEAASSTSVYASPGRTQYHPGVAKAWAYVTQSGGTYTLQTSHNITSITKNSTGNVTVTIATDFSTANWSSVFTGESGGSFVNQENGTKTAGVGIADIRNTSNVNIDAGFNFAGFGDQA